jgi:hypothetical protein
LPFNVDIIGFFGFLLDFLKFINTTKTAIFKKSSKNDEKLTKFGQNRVFLGIKGYHLLSTRNSYKKL